ncbi:MAG: hypothetical protein H7839_10085 [Magnetococcus sp. YQC-5]
MTQDSGSPPSWWLKAMDQISDPYERQSRLYPALLALSPLVVLVISLYGERLALISTVTSTFVMCGVLFLLTDLARHLGKAKEQALWNKWGGIPSTQVLRHSDSTFDSISTKRYHTILTKTTGLKFPLPHEETANPAAADAAYTSAGNMLREATRDTTKFALLFRDNISYGFRRNGFGLKPIGLIICLCCILWVGIRHGISPWEERFHNAIDLESFFDAGELATLAAASLMMLVWQFFFTEKAARDAAFSYARKLILACESLPDH